MNFFRPMAISLGLLNLVNGISSSTFILFSQEILKTSVFVFAILGTAGAIGGTVGGVLSPKLIKKLGSGRALELTLIIGPMANLIIGFTTSWQIVWLLTSFWVFFSVTWNVVTVSLRQSVIPTELLGRVNSVYRFFWLGEYSNRKFSRRRNRFRAYRSNEPRKRSPHTLFRCCDGERWNLFLCQTAINKRENRGDEKDRRRPSVIAANPGTESSL